MNRSQMEEAVVDSMSTHPMEGYVEVVTHYRVPVLPESGDVLHHRDQQV